MSTNDQPAQIPWPTGDAARTGPPPLRPMTLGNVLGSTAKLIGANLGTVALLVVAFMLLQTLLSAAWTYTFRADEDWQFFRYWLFFLTLALPVGVPVVNGMLSRVVAATLLGRSRRFRPALGATVGRYPALLAVVVVQLPLVWLSVLLVVYGVLGPVTLLWLTAPAIVLATLCWFSVSAVMLERLGPIAGIRRSFRLVVDRFWRVLGTMALVLLLVSLGVTGDRPSPVPVQCLLGGAP